MLTEKDLKKILNTIPDNIMEKAKDFTQKYEIPLQDIYKVSNIIFKNDGIIVDFKDILDKLPTMEAIDKLLTLRWELVNYWLVLIYGDGSD